MTRRVGRNIICGCAVAAGAALIAIVLSWRGAGWPAQVYRVHLFHTVGFTQWDNQWYGGHHSPGYSVLFPMLGDLLSPTGAGVLSVLVATAAFASIVADAGIELLADPPGRLALDPVHTRPDRRLSSATALTLRRVGDASRLAEPTYSRYRD